MVSWMAVLIPGLLLSFLLRFLLREIHSEKEAKYELFLPQPRLSLSFSAIYEILHMFALKVVEE